MRYRVLIDVQCICLGHVRKIPLIDGDYQLGCPSGGLFNVVIEYIAGIEWKITHDTKDIHGNLSSITQRRFITTDSLPSL